MHFSTNSESVPVSGAPLEVAVGVLRRGDGAVLLGRRPAGGHLAGYWEFPGGKLEAGETPLQALARELHEELGIEVDAAAPLMRRHHHYPASAEHPGRRVVLHTFEVTAWHGEPRGRLSQALRWSVPQAIDPADLPAANGPLLTAARLPDVYAISGSVDADREAFLQRVRRLPSRGVRLLCLRCPGLAPDAYRALAAAVIGVARPLGVAVMLHGDGAGLAALAVTLGAAGVHLPARALRTGAGRTLPGALWLAASCHDADELAAAAAAGCDFAVLSPVAVTASHPQQAPLGWARFEALLETAELPVYALGGMRPDDAALARRHGGRGVAVLRAVWD